jgi:hypothetical protein
MTTSVETVLAPYIGPGEQLLWSGRPPRGIRLRVHDWFMIPFSLVFGGSIFIGECVLIAAAWRSPGLLQLVLPFANLPLTIFGLYPLVGRFVVEARSLARTYYGVANKQILVVGGMWSKEVDRLKLACLNEMSVTAI